MKQEFIIFFYQLEASMSEIIQEKSIARNFTASQQPYSLDTLIVILNRKSGLYCKVFGEVKYYSHLFSIADH